MAKVLTISRRYRMPKSLVEKLQSLSKYNIVESKFVRAAIEEKLERDLPIIKFPKEKSDYPF